MKSIIVKTWQFILREFIVTAVFDVLKAMACEVIIYNIQFKNHT